MKTLRNGWTTQDGCYICRPDDPDASEDGCEACFRDWVEYYHAAYLSQPSDDGGSVA